MNGIYLLLGSNIGDRLDNLRKAVSYLSKNNLKVLDESSIYETAPWGKENQQWFLNLIIQIETQMDPQHLLAYCLEVEKKMGRVREEKWGVRIIDVDILYYNNKEVKLDNLIIPHPGIPDRRFTLIPLAELCPQEFHPTIHRTQVQLLANCTDTLDCRLTDYYL